jgi:hypothetical protein
LRGRNANGTRPHSGMLVWLFLDSSSLILYQSLMACKVSDVFEQQLADMK